MKKVKKPTNITYGSISHIDMSNYTIVKGLSLDTENTTRICGYFTSPNRTPRGKKKIYTFIHENKVIEKLFKNPVMEIFVFCGYTLKKSRWDVKDLDKLGIQFINPIMLEHLFACIGVNLEKEYPIYYEKTKIRTLESFWENHKLPQPKPKVDEKTVEKFNYFCKIITVMYLTRTSLRMILNITKSKKLNEDIQPVEICQFTSILNGNPEDWIFKILIPKAISLWINDPNESIFETVSHQTLHILTLNIKEKIRKSNGFLDKYGKYFDDDGVFIHTHWALMRYLSCQPRPMYVEVGKLFDVMLKNIIKYSQKRTVSINVKALMRFSKSRIDTNLKMNAIEKTQPKVYDFFLKFLSVLEDAKIITVIVAEGELEDDKKGINYSGLRAEMAIQNKKEFDDSRIIRDTAISMSTPVSIQDLSKIDKIVWKDLNKDQEKAMRYIQMNKFVVVTGAGGTGKTHIIKKMIEYFCGKFENVVLTTVYSGTHLVHFKIFKHLLSTSFEMYNVAELLTKNKHTKSFEKCPPFTLIIDETQNLSKELMAQLFRLNIERIVMVGDPELQISAFHDRAMMELIHSKIVKVCKLSVNMRVENVGNNLALGSKYIRNVALNPTPTKISKLINFMKKANDGSLTLKFTNNNNISYVGQKIAENGFENSIILTGENKTRNEYNKIIHKILGNDKGDGFNINVKSQDYHDNSLISCFPGTILEAVRKIDFKIISSRKVCPKISGTVKMWTKLCSTAKVANHEEKFNVKVSYGAVMRERFKLMSIVKKDRYFKVKLYSYSSEGIKNFYIYGNTIYNMFGLSYSVTIDSSIGSECDTVYFILSSKSEKWLDTRRMYTAISRASKKLTIVANGERTFKNFMLKIMKSKIKNEKTGIFMKCNHVELSKLIGARIMDKKRKREDDHDHILNPIKKIKPE